MLHTFPLAVPAIATVRRPSCSEKKPSLLIVRRHPLTQIRSDQLIHDTLKKQTDKKNKKPTIDSAGEGRQEIFHRLAERFGTFKVLRVEK